MAASMAMASSVAAWSLSHNSHSHSLLVSRRLPLPLLKPKLLVLVSSQHRHQYHVPLLSLRCRCSAEERGTARDTNEDHPPEGEGEGEGEDPAPQEEEGESMFSGPLFDWPDETHEDVAKAFERLYGPAYSAESHLGGNIYHMDPVVDKLIDEFDNLIVTKPVDDFEERVIQVRRVTKVVKGGKNLSFRAVVVVGDKKGHVGVGLGKALEVSEAVVKAVINGRRNIVTVPLTKHLTFPHRATGKFRAAEVMLRPAAPGSGVIAGGAVRAVLELAGLQNALGKQLGSDNALNNARAAVVATQQMRHLADVARDRGIPMEELWK
ncbi:30S ribosomal protein S5 [Rhynchospora pubera]|uniref:Small ribosomal subunit protein uS5c n=1 Tax=Rhynchospora pubera TaxID=906938 RepID=A0AAV8GZX7_9POAL|nr:30S ribosomal protein S5 [Rhynchospora pubera]